VDSPRIYANIQFQSMIYVALDHLATVYGIRTTGESQEEIMYKYTKNTMSQFTQKKLRQKNSVAFSDDINVIKYDNKKPERKSSRLPTSKSKSRDKSRSSIAKTNTSKIIFDKRNFDANVGELSDASTPRFDPDFLLSTVFGYQAVIIRTEDGIFTVFEPIKRKSFTDEPEYARNLLNGYKSEESEFSQFEESSEEDFEHDNITRFHNGKLKKKACMEEKKLAPRNIIRRQTNTPFAGVSPRVDKVLKRDKTGNMDWIPHIRRSSGRTTLQIDTSKRKVYQLNRNKFKEKDHSFEEIKHTHTAPHHQLKDNLFEKEPLNSPTISNVSKSKDKKEVNLGKYRWANRKRRSSNYTNIYDLLDSMEDAKSENDVPKFEDYKSGDLIQPKKAIHPPNSECKSM
jgi:hypothetical protein